MVKWQELGIKRVSVFKNFGTAQFVYGDLEIEFVGARKESYNRGSRKPIVEDGTIEDDQNRRDFTINALALSLSKDNYGELIDPFGGMRHLDMGIIKTPLDPDITFSDDPLRMLRAIRFATQLDFSIVPESLKLLNEMLSDFRSFQWKEYIRSLIRSSWLTSLDWFKLLSKTGLLKQFFPEMEALRGVEKRNGISHKDNFSTHLRS